jgi:hypothetical protein
MKRIVAPTFLAAWLIACLGLLWAADEPTNKPPEQPAEQQKAARPKFRSFRGTIKAFDKTAMTLTVEGEQAETFHLTSQTRIWKEGQPATLDALTAGEMVRGAARQGAEGRWEAMSLYLGKPVLRKAPPAQKDEPKKQGQPQAK